MDNKRVITTCLLIFFVINSAVLEARRVREVQEADIELPFGYFTNIRDVCSDYEAGVDGENLDIWSVFSRNERIKIFDTLMFLVLKDTFDFASLDLIEIFSMRPETPTIQCIIEQLNVTGIQNIIEVEVGPEKIGWWLQRERSNSMMLLENLANGGFFTLDDISMYIDEYMTLHRRPFIISSDYSYDILLTMIEWIMESPGFALIIQNHLLNR